jgi:hypothetical protein
VTLQLQSGSNFKSIAWTLTNGTGYYQFTNLYPSVVLNGEQYKVIFKINPILYKFTTEGVGSDPTINSAANQTSPSYGETNPFTLPPETFDINENAGLIALAQTTGTTGTTGRTTGLPFVNIGQVVWFDTNYNGQRDAGESGVGNVTVILSYCNGSVIATTQTNSS